VQQDLPDRDGRTAHRGYHTHTVTGSEVARLHFAVAAFHDHISGSERAQRHGHALKDTKRARKLALTELHHESTDEDGADDQDVEVCDPESETAPHVLLHGVRS